MGKSDVGGAMSSLDMSKLGGRQVWALYVAGQPLGRLSAIPRWCYAGDSSL